ncbi:MAG: sulfurtransferase TusA family protein [Candidatus Caldatribacteriota bacterium]|jgi:tRNA 2-thiouridine synthesizing protein A|nr:sulfurtransferase TusA family protein [Atribacterota bacterium]MDD3032127.1 sulfurtransferase TusA family protein [Atribacterota bacterium]MDD3641576.1 sulfurtransferase TusA family protein [Atribacterota bacterium]MDD4289168.1 sulfurtransferase TusA family protein [Atribacterota bacterium]MDD4765762.1 sulfurtransferase TusA family protein [Atribacterota bacterium]
MSEKFDVRGLSCPLPVVKVKKKLAELQEGILEVIVDTGTAKDNVSRMANNAGWKVEVKAQEDEYLLIITK